MDANSFNIPRRVTSSEEAQQVYNAVEDERRQRRAAMRAAAHDLAQAVQGLERAQQQLSLADQRAGRARFIIVKSGFPSFARPQIQLRPAPILQTAERRIISVPGGSLAVVLD